MNFDSRLWQIWGNKKGEPVLQQVKLSHLMRQSCSLSIISYSVNSEQIWLQGILVGFRDRIQWEWELRNITRLDSHVAKQHVWLQWALHSFCPKPRHTQTKPCSTSRFVCMKFSLRLHAIDFIVQNTPAYASASTRVWVSAQFSTEWRRLKSVPF